MTKHKIQDKFKFKIPKFKTLVLIFVIGILNSFCALNFDICHLHIVELAFAQSSSKEEESLFLAKRALEDGFYDVSRGMLENFIKDYPNSSKISEANLLIGECYFHQNKFLEALNKFEDILKQPSSKDTKDAIFYWIAEVHFKGNNFNKAAQYYKMVVDDYPKSAYLPAAYYSLGWCLFQEQDFNQALNYFKAVQDKFPKEAQAQDSIFKIIECLYSLKDYQALKDKANAYLNLYPKDAPRRPYVNFYIAEADYYLGNFTDSINEYMKVISASVDNRVIALSKLGIGWAQLKLKKYKEAEDYFMQLNVSDLEAASQNTLILGKAILYSETSRLLEAKNAYDQLLGISFDPVVLLQAYLGKADVLYNMAEYKESIKVYKEAQEKADKDLVPAQIIDKLHYGLAFALLKEGEFKDAIGEFQKIAQSSEDRVVKVSALCQIGDTYQDSGDYQKAQEAYDTILKDYPDSLYSDYVQYQLGVTLLKSSNYDGAIMSFLALKRNYPQSKLLDDASYALGLAYFQRQDYNSSREIFEKFQDEFKDSNLRAQALYLLGTSLYNLGKFSEAIEVFKNIMRTYNDDNELVQKSEYEIADCFYQMGNEKEAMARFKNLRSKYPDSKLAPEVIWWLGEYYYRHNDSSLARRYFLSLIQDFPKSALLSDAYYAVGSICMDEGDFDKAIENFNKVIELDKSDLRGTASIVIADIYTKQEKVDLALKIYEETGKTYPNLVNLVYPKIAEIYYKASNFDRALEFYRKSLEVVPIKEMSNIQFNIAEILQSQGKIQEAIEEYLKVTYLYSENSDLTVKALLRVAAIYEDKNNYNEALSIYKKIVSMDREESKTARERIDWIKARK